MVHFTFIGFTCNTQNRTQHTEKGAHALQRLVLTSTVVHNGRRTRPRTSRDVPRPRGTLLWRWPCKEASVRYLLPPQAMFWPMARTSCRLSLTSRQGCSRLSALHTGKPWRNAWKQGRTCTSTVEPRCRCSLVWQRPCEERTSRLCLCLLPPTVIFKLFWRSGQ